MLFFFSLILPLLAADDISQKLEELRLPSDKITPLISDDKKYLVTKRYSSLRNRHELTIGGGNNFLAESHLVNTQTLVGYRYHINPKWSFGLRHTEYFNELSASGKKLFEDQRLLPDTDYALKSSSAVLTYNTSYGKFRLAKDTVVHFDHYIGASYGDITLANGVNRLNAIETGFAFWIGRHLSARFALNNERYTQRKLKGDTQVSHLTGFVELGYLFGKGDYL